MAKDLFALPADLPVPIDFCYPRTGRPGEPSLVEDWDQIPGARGCTLQVCGFRDLYSELRHAGIQQVFGLSTQTAEYQREAVERLNLPFPLLSDEGLELTRALRLPTLHVASHVLTKRLTLVARAGRILHVFYPVFPPDQSAEHTLSWVTENHTLLQENDVSGESNYLLRW